MGRFSKGTYQQEKLEYIVASSKFDCLLKELAEKVAIDAANMESINLSPAGTNDYEIEMLVPKTLILEELISLLEVMKNNSNKLIK